MSQAAGNKEHISLMLSEVLDDIGVNERMTKKRRKTLMFMETIGSITFRPFCTDVISFYLGSQSEGTTTFGLNSDADLLLSWQNYNIIQDLSEWEYGKINYLMIQEEDISPGYCFLQVLQSDKTSSFIECEVKERVLLTNKIRTEATKYFTQCGPSFVKQQTKGIAGIDTVLAFPCKSWPQSALGWLKHHDRNWPKEEIIKNAASTQCFVVPTGNKMSKYPELEWRISTTLAERCLMFDLNITQIRCYVLMKMILKSFLNAKTETNLSSYMCKTVLFHCIQRQKPSIWKEKKLKDCLAYCLLELKSCVENGHLSHFIIKENNLMAGKFTDETKQQLLKNIHDFIQNDVQILFTFTTDDLGYRLQAKLNPVPQRDCYFLQPISYTDNLSITLHQSVAGIISSVHAGTLFKLQSIDIKASRQFVEKLIACSKNGNKLEKPAYKLVAPFYYATYGSVLASESIGLKCQMSPQAFVWLVDGSDSDVLSGRLKLASVFYCTGEMEKAEQILRHTEQQYHSYYVLHICECWGKLPRAVSSKLQRISYKNIDNCIKHHTTFCARFLRQEKNCVPHELQYEMFRSTQDDKIKRDKVYYWMDWAVVDSLPFLYFLQYKIYGHLQRYQDQQEALTKLTITIETENNLTHKETTLNILGQCMEQENKPRQAIKYYLLSLKQRAKNNAAKIHICRLLFSLLVAKYKK